MARGAALWAVAFGVVASASLPAQANVWPSSHQRVARALGSDDVAQRRGAARDLPSLPPAMARKLARRALGDPDVEVRLLAAQAAVELGAADAGDEVIEWLSARDARLRRAACELIEASPTPRAVAALGRVLGDAKAEVRQAAASAMGSSGSGEVVPPLLGHLDDSSTAVRLEVVRALGRLGDGRAVVPLINKLQDSEVEVRQAAAQALGALGDQRAVATLMLALRDSSDAVRVDALEALGRLRAEEATTAIAALLADEAAASTAAPRSSHSVRDAALRALGRMATAAAVQILIEQLERVGPELSAASSGRAPEAAPTTVRQALVLTGPAAVDALTRAVRTSSSTRTASGAALALGELGARQALPSIVRAIERGTVSLSSGLEALADLEDDAALPFVLEYIDHPDARTRQQVIAVACQLLDPSQPDGRPLDPVKPRLLDPRTGLGERIALVRLLGRTGSERARKVLLALADAEPLALRVAVVDALGIMGLPSRKVDQTLLDALDDDALELRQAAAVSLARVGTEHAARALLHRLGVSAEQDRSAMGLALSGVLERSSEPSLVEPVEASFAVASGPLRDALIEALGRMPTQAAARALERMAHRTDPDDRRKVAESLAGHPEQASTLVVLARDPDPSVRAQALWSLRRVGDRSSLSRIEASLRDLDVAVAGNAAIALAAVAHRTSAEAEAAPKLCAALSDYRSYVRANALSGLRLLGRRCRAGLVRRLLLGDRSWRVRVSAAQLLRGLPAAGAEAEVAPDRRALERCAREDRNATVAASCAASHPPQAGSSSQGIVVFVVPHGRYEPGPRAPYALALADGTLRLGVADRRGALFEGAAPRGPIELAVPAALAR